MTDAFSIVTGTFGILGTLGGVASTITTVRESGARRHVERARGASALLGNLKELPVGHAVGTRLMTQAGERELCGELSRIVRENAAAYAKQNPTPVGFDIARVLMPAYCALFASVGVGAFVAAGREEAADAVAAQQLSGGLFFVIALMFLIVTAVLYERMVARNDARRMAGTPGREYYFGPIVELGHMIAGASRKRRARRRAENP